MGSNGDLDFLAGLTTEGVKPLSRVEWDLGLEELQTLRALGLRYRKVHRVALDGTVVTHVVFSRDASLVDCYHNQFEGTTLVKTPEVIRSEGEFFGFPSCCVESFIATGESHVPNELSPQDQSLLYHLACPGCRLTPDLVPRYRALWSDQVLS